MIGQEKAFAFLSVRLHIPKDLEYHINKTQGKFGSQKC
jgi:hypothetical protein